MAVLVEVFLDTPAELEARLALLFDTEEGALLLSRPGIQMSVLKVVISIFKVQFQGSINFKN
jgi:hypothetical protein